MPDIEPALFTPYERAFCPSVMLSDYAFSLCGGPCAGLFTIRDEGMLLDLIRVCQREKLPFKVLGGLTNVLVSDSGYKGVVLLNRKGEISHTSGRDGSILLSAGSGVSMASLVKYCIENGFSGLEWAAGLPGTVGGAVYGNAGAFGSDTASVFDHGEFVDASGSRIILKCGELGFGYRTSSMKKGLQLFILKAVFRLNKGDLSEIEALAEEYRSKRKKTQPYNERSLGSVFKNPEGFSAGKLIQDAGMKGLSVGCAVVSSKHANFITTTKGVTSADYRELVSRVQETVEAVSGIHLEPEIEFLGFSE